MAISVLERSATNPVDPVVDGPALDVRFDRVIRLVGNVGFQRLKDAHVAVYGLGGVGSFAAEALVRSGVGRLTLVDHDNVSPTNFNRQIHALDGQLGQPKARAMEERFKRINPHAVIHAHVAFYDAPSSAHLIPADLDYAVDALDNLCAKAHLLATLLARRIPVVTSLGSAGKWDPTRIRVDRMDKVQGCRLLHALKKILRQKYALDDQGLRGSPLWAVHSDEPRRGPLGLPGGPAAGHQGGYVPPPCREDGLDPDRHPVNGTACFVTACFGMFAASRVVHALVEGGADPAGRSGPGGR